MPHSPALERQPLALHACPGQGHGCQFGALQTVDTSGYWTFKRVSLGHTGLWKSSQLGMTPLLPYLEDELENSKIQGLKSFWDGCQLSDCTVGAGLHKAICYRSCHYLVWHRMSCLWNDEFLVCFNCIDSFLYRRKKDSFQQFGFGSRTQKVGSLSKRNQRRSSFCPAGVLLSLQERRSKQTDHVGCCTS